jgi:hypothetical protein
VGESTEAQLPWVIPRSRPLELLFCRRAFERLRLQISDRLLAAEGEELDLNEIQLPLPLFQRVFGRLFRVFGNDGGFDARSFDLDGNGSVEWKEFVDMWKRLGPTAHLSIPERTFITLEDPNSSFLSKVIARFLTLAILLSTVGFVLATTAHFATSEENPTAPGEWLEPRPLPALHVIETTCIIIFTLEYLLRFITSPFTRTELIDYDKLLDLITDDEPIFWRGPFGRLYNFVFNVSNIIDLVAIIPYYIELSSGSTANRPSGLVVLRAVRLARIFRVIRVAKYGEAMSVVVKALKASSQVLWVLCLNLLLGVVIFSAIMYNAESSRWNPQERIYERVKTRIWIDDEWRDQWEPTPFHSIPATFWWAFVTCTTVGYGDDYPRTPWGKVVATITALWGVIMLALPIGVVANNFGIIWEQVRQEKLNQAKRKKKEQALLHASLSIFDRITQRSLLRVEVYDDHGVAPQIQKNLSKVSGSNAARKLSTFSASNDFMGEVQIPLNLALDEYVCERLVLPLQSDSLKAKRRAQGTITLEYEWLPAELMQGVGDRIKTRVVDGDGGDSLANGDDRQHLEGELTVRIISAQDLINLDWKVSGVSDPFCIVQVYPYNPSPDGELLPEIWRTSTVWNCLKPQWNEEMTFLYEGCTKNDQSYDPSVHGSLERAAEHYALTGSLAGLGASLGEKRCMSKGSSSNGSSNNNGDCRQEPAATASKSSNNNSNCSEEIQGLRKEVRDLKQMVQTLVAAMQQTQSVEASNGSTQSNGNGNLRSTATAATIHLNGAHFDHSLPGAVHPQ